MFYYNNIAETILSIPFLSLIFVKYSNEFSISKTYPSSIDISNQFPKEFIFGAASAAYQIEGAWNRDGKGASIWDTLTQTRPDLIKDHSNGNIAANSYELYPEDIRAIKEIGMNFYRFSISWSRVLPNGDISSKNELGLQYYDKIIDLCLENGIEPMVTMYHYDLPQALQDFGGWTNPIIIDYFVEYARLLIDRYGDRVRTWFTFNEPHEYCVLGYGTGEEAPLIATPGTGDYLCGHHTLLSHARVYRMYKNEYTFYKGSMGIVLNTEFMWPKDPNNLDDVQAADRSLQFYVGWFAHPVFSKSGDYPEVMRQIIDKNSIDEGHTWSRLPKFTKEEIEMVKGSSDFYGLNYYTGNYVITETNQSAFPNPSWDRDRNVRTTQNESWPVAASPWLRAVPEGLRGLINWVKNEYNNPDIFITENGWSDSGNAGNDEKRIRYIGSHLQAVLDAIWIDGCRVVGYGHWSIIDNFEWMAGFTERFGLYHVDYNSTGRERTAKPSSFYFKEMIETRKIPDYGYL